MSPLPHKPALDPPSTTLLVTGASGYIASHIVNEALALGYTVRGTARTQAKCDATSKIYNSPRYSAVVVPDFGRPSQEIEDAVRGVQSVCMVAGDTTMNDDPDQVIKSVVVGVEAFLEAARRVGGVKRFTLTSSSTAVMMPKPGVEISVDVNTWDDEAVDAAWNKSGEAIGPNGYGFVVYAASKTEGERAFWKFKKEKNPEFVCNAVLPDTNMGRVLEGGSAGVTGVIMIDLFREGKKAFLPPRELFFGLGGRVRADVMQSISLMLLMMLGCIFVLRCWMGV